MALTAFSFFSEIRRTSGTEQVSSGHLRPRATKRPQARESNLRWITRKKAAFRLLFSMMFALRANDAACGNDVRFARDVCLRAHEGKHRIIATAGSNIISTQSGEASSAVIGGDIINTLLRQQNQSKRFEDERYRAAAPTVSVRAAVLCHERNRPCFLSGSVVTETKV